MTFGQGKVMSNKTFLLNMDDESSCSLMKYGEFIGIFYCDEVQYRKCDGKLNNRPEWCPLKEVKWFQIYQGNDAYHEVKK